MAKKRYGLSIAHEHVNQLVPKKPKVHVEPPAPKEQVKAVRKLIKWENLANDKH